MLAGPCWDHPDAGLEDHLQGGWLAAVDTHARGHSAARRSQVAAGGPRRRLASSPVARGSAASVPTPRSGLPVAGLDVVDGLVMALAVATLDCQGGPDRSRPLVNQRIDFDLGGARPADAPAHPDAGDDGTGGLKHIPVATGGQEEGREPRTERITSLV